MLKRMWRENWMKGNGRKGFYLEVSFFLVFFWYALCTIWFITNKFSNRQLLAECVCWKKDWEKLPWNLIYPFCYNIFVFSSFSFFVFRTIKLDFPNKITTTPIIQDNLFKLCSTKLFVHIFTAKWTERKIRCIFNI